eukprot:Rhum_TRINITY_DN8288_c0_g1::Rhum_TRINITY_DN8288_c0_g1_i1::g.27089::m.27089
MLLEALTVGAVTDGVGKVLSVIGSVRKLEQKFDPAMSDFVLLWHRLSALDAPLRLLQRLQTREATRGDVEAAVQTATLVTEEVCAFLESDQPEDDERPNDFESWRRWLVQAKGHISRKEALPALSTRLDRAVQTVQVTLLTVQLTHAKIAADPCYPFLWLQGVAERAINIYSKILNGSNERGDKVLAAGDVWRQSGSSWRRLGRGALVLDANSDPEATFTARVRNVDDDDDDLNEEFALDEQARVTRAWGSDKSLGDGLEDALVYKLPGGSGLLLQFASPPATGSERTECSISAELFEVLYTLLRTKDQDITADMMTKNGLPYAG